MTAVEVITMYIQLIIICWYYTPEHLESSKQNNVFILNGKVVASIKFTLNRDVLSCSSVSGVCKMFDKTKNIIEKVSTVLEGTDFTENQGSEKLKSGLKQYYYRIALHTQCARQNK